VRFNLSVVDDLDTNAIKFKEISEHEFTGEFFYLKKRRVFGVFGPEFGDATIAYPANLKKGYQGLFTRQTGDLFTRIQSNIRKELFCLLEQDGFILTEAENIEWVKNKGLNLDNFSNPGLTERYTLLIK
jgi:hypothetical protein